MTATPCIQPQRTPHTANLVKPHEQYVGCVEQLRLRATSTIGTPEVSFMRVVKHDLAKTPEE